LQSGATGETQREIVARENGLHALAAAAAIFRIRAVNA